MWEISNKEQLITISVALCYGALACVFYDLIRAVRKAGLNSFAEVFIGDVFFFTVSAVFFFLLSLSRTAGETRGYVVLSALAGFALTRITVSAIAFPALCFVIRGIFRIFGFLSGKTADLCDMIFAFIKRLELKNRKLLNKLKKCLKNSRKLLYNKGNFKKGREKANEGKA